MSCVQYPCVSFVLSRSSCQGSVLSLQHPLAFFACSPNMHCGHADCFGCSWLFYMLHNCSAVNYMALMLLPPPPQKSIFIHHTLICYSTQLRRIFSDFHTKFCFGSFRKMKWRNERHSQAESVQWYQKRAFLSSVLQSTVFAVCTTCYSIQRLYISFLDTINLCRIIKQSYTCPSPRKVDTRGVAV
jgi:hypothetical protein